MVIQVKIEVFEIATKMDHALLIETYFDSKF